MVVCGPFDASYERKQGSIINIIIGPLCKLVEKIGSYGRSVIIYPSTVYPMKLFTTFTGQRVSPKVRKGQEMHPNMSMKVYSLESARFGQGSARVWVKSPRGAVCTWPPCPCVMRTSPPCLRYTACQDAVRSRSTQGFGAVLSAQRGMATRILCRPVVNVQRSPGKHVGGQPSVLRALSRVYHVWPSQAQGDEAGLAGVGLFIWLGETQFCFDM